MSDDSEFSRIREAYFQMAHKAEYRPSAPTDGGGNILLSGQELRNSTRLQQEASTYANQFMQEENSHKFWIGVSDFPTNRAFAYTIEAARALCGSVVNRSLALKLLEMAVSDVTSAISIAKP
jgi:hypothetical protein